MRYLRTSTLAASAACLLMASPAYAYIDPGTGSFLLQIALAGVLSVGFVMKTWWARIRDRFVRRPERDGGAPDA